MPNDSLLEPTAHQGKGGSVVSGARNNACPAKWTGSSPSKLTNAEEVTGPLRAWLSILQRQSWGGGVEEMYLLEFK